MYSNPILMIRASGSAHVHAAGHPLGLLYIAGFLRAHRYSSISLLDLRVIPKRLQFREVEAKIANLNPWVIGISSMSYEAPETAKLAKIVRRSAPNATIVIGGAFPSSAPIDAMRTPEIDYAVVGEGEQAFLQLLRGLKNGSLVTAIPGLAHRGRDGEIVTNPSKPIEDIDQLPFPAWDLIDFDLYDRSERFNRWYKEKRYMNIITSRGCPYQCGYCHNVHGKAFRPRSPNSIVSEMKYLMNTYGVREFVIVDDTFNADLQRAKDICDQIVQAKVKCYLTFPNGLRADLIDRELLVKLKAAGTYRVAYAIETTSIHLMNIIGKRLDIEKAQSVIKWTDELGILSHGFFLLGLPEETPQDIESTIKFAARSWLHTANFFFLDIYPGTRFWRLTEEKHNRLTTFDVPYGFHVPLSLVSDLSPVLLGKLCRKAHRQFYLRPWRILRLFSMLSLRFFINGIGVFLLRGFLMWRFPLKGSRGINKRLNTNGYRSR